MKVEMKKAIDVTQTAGSGAETIMGGALGLAGTGAFAALLSTFTAGDPKQSALQSTNFQATKENVDSPPSGMNTNPDTAKETTQEYDKAALNTAAKPETSNSNSNSSSSSKPSDKANNSSNSKPGNSSSGTPGNTASTTKVQSHESKESNENDADADNAGRVETKKTAAQAIQAPQTAQSSDQKQPPVKMEDIIKALNLNDQQVQQLAQALNVTTSDLKQMQIAVKTDGQSGGVQLTGIMADGKTQNLSAMLGMNSVGGKAAPAQAVMDKIAGILKLDNTQKQDFFAQLNISSISSNPSNDIKTADGGTILKNSNAAKQSDQAQPAANSAGTAVETGKAAVQAAAQSDSNGNDGNSFNGEAGAQVAAAVQKDVTVTEQSQKADFSVALGKAGETAGATAAHGAKTTAIHTAGQTVAAETAKPEAKVMNQIVEKASILQLPNATQTKISLNPKDLGNVDIKLTMHDSSVTASIVVENNAVKQVVEQNLDQLKNALHHQGITVDEMMVTVDQQNGGNAQNSNQSPHEAAASIPYTGAAQRAPEPAAAAPAFMRRPIGNHRVSVTA